jgi:hypothetical protein
MGSVTHDEMTKILIRKARKYAEGAEVRRKGSFIYSNGEPVAIIFDPVNYGVIAVDTYKESGKP